MSRHGYTDDWDYDNQIGYINYRGAVASALRGKRGQDFLQEMLEAMATMPKHELIAGELVHEGAACALGTVALKRGMDVSNLDIEDAESVAAAFGIAVPMAREIMWVNDKAYDWNGNLTDAARFEKVRRWIEGELYERNQK